MRSRDVVPVQVTNVPDFWSRARNAEHRLLALDYDGTLAPFHVDPMLARPLPGIRSCLKTLSEARHTTVAIISGRPAREVAVLLGGIDIPLIGCHGFETIDRDGNLTVRSPSRMQKEALKRAAYAAFWLGLEERVETKTAGIALHTRGMPSGVASIVETTFLHEWSLMAPSGLKCRRFNGGVEIHCSGWNKGDAFKKLLKNLPDGTFPVYLGDDRTDEDVFGFLKEKGIGIKVGSPETSTAATGFLPDCEAVGAFLNTWLALMPA